IYFARRLADKGMVQRVPGGGGAVETVAEAEAGEFFFDPIPIPGGAGIVVTLQREGTASLIAINLRSGKRVSILDNAAALAVLPSGRIVAQGRGRSLAAPFDLRRLTPTTEFAELDGLTNVAVSREGTLVGFTASAGDNPIVSWVSRSGVVTAIDPSWTASNALTPALSPDGSRLAISVAGGLYVKLLDDGASSRLPYAPESALAFRPAWRPDGRMIAFVTGRSSPAGDARAGNVVLVGRADGIGEARPLVTDPRGIAEVRWSPDGRWILYRSDNTGTGAGDVMAVAATGDQRPIALLDSRAREYTPALSPDGRWLAYATDASGQFEVYVRPFPNVNDAKYQVSLRGGVQPRWAHHGGELFYIGGDHALIAAGLDTGAGFRVVSRTPLFSLDALGVDIAPWQLDYDVAPDDQRFVMIRRTVGRLRPVWVEAWPQLLTRVAAR
ncbi:MAG TPA: hypothetical protein VNL37_04990, partial [Candidatus Polarisedimenticolia bacterium]|nr:hypothetical protein [Candidatus Polarisedimenticolia bacterium]